jgi:hypothetical protein
MVKRLIPVQCEAEGEANLPVYMALGLGMTGESATRALVDLLRSDHPIQPAIRELLADAFEGTHPRISTKLEGKVKRGPAFTAEVAKKRIAATLDDVRIGQWIAEHPDASKRGAGEAIITEAREKFGITRAEAFTLKKQYLTFREQMRGELSP